MEREEREDRGAEQIAEVGERVAAVGERLAAAEFRGSVNTFINSQTKINEAMTNFFTNHLPHLSSDVARIDERTQFHSKLFFLVVFALMVSIAGGLATTVFR